jgi:hypothetical protein
MSNSISDLNKMFKEAYSEKIDEIIRNYNCHNWTVDEWIKYREEISEKDIRQFPNAKTANGIKNSKLYKVMK